MKKDVRKVLLTCTLLVIVMSMSAQLSQHGLVLNGGIGCVKHQYRTYYESGQSGYYPYGNGDYIWKEYNYKSGFSVGYRLRFTMPVPKSFHYDMDVIVGAKVLKSTNYNYTYTPDEEVYGYAIYDRIGYSSSAPYYFTSIGGTVNYSIIRNISVGLGIEPTLYLNRAMKNYADIPIVAKVAYDFKVVEVGITGKYGLANVLQSYDGGSTKLRFIQLSLFIPFKTK